jgi:hypothetical protein
MTTLLQVLRIFPLLILALLGILGATIWSGMILSWWLEDPEYGLKEEKED